MCFFYTRCFFSGLILINDGRLLIKNYKWIKRKYSYKMWRFYLGTFYFISKLLLIHTVLQLCFGKIFDCFLKIAQNATTLKTAVIKSSFNYQTWKPFRFWKEIYVMWNRQHFKQFIDVPSQAICMLGLNDVSTNRLII